MKMDRRTSLAGVDGARAARVHGGEALDDASAAGGTAADHSLETKDHPSEIKDHSLEITDHYLELRDQRSLLRDQRSLLRDQRSKIIPQDPNQPPSVQMNSDVRRIALKERERVIAKKAPVRASMPSINHSFHSHLSMGFRFLRRSLLAPKLTTPDGLLKELASRPL